MHMLWLHVSYTIPVHQRAPYEGWFRHLTLLHGTLLEQISMPSLSTPERVTVEDGISVPSASLCRVNCVSDVDELGEAWARNAEMLKQLCSPTSVTFITLPLSLSLPLFQWVLLTTCHQRGYMKMDTTSNLTSGR